MIKKLFKWLFRLLGVVLGLAILAYVTLLLINWKDRPPSETAQEFSDAIANLPAVADEDNSYLLVKEFPNLNSYREPKESEFAAAAAKDCQSSRGIAGCLDEVAVQNYGAKLWLQEQQWILDKYIEVITRPKFLEPIAEDPLASKLLSYGDIGYAHRLLMVSAMVSASDGDKSRVIALLEADLKFWRMLLRTSDILIAKQIASAYVRNHFIEGNRVLLELHKKDRLHTLPANWLVEIGNEEKSMQRALIGEWQYIENFSRVSLSSVAYASDPTASPSVQFMDRLKWRLLVPLVQLQDISNNHAAMLETMIEVLDVPLREFPAALEESEALIFEHPTRFGGLYNPTASIHFPLMNNFGRYFAPSADLEGIRRAAVLTTLLREQQISADDIADELEASPYTNPYNDEAFEWDSESGEIVFRGLGDRFDGVYRFRY